MPRRPLTVDSPAILAALTTRDEGLLGTYLDLQTGGLVRVYDPAIVGRSNDAAEGRLDAEPDRYAKIPLYSREYRLMTEFVDTVEDDDLARLLDAALAGRSAFRRFDGTLGAWPAERARWEAFRHAALLRWAAAWLRAQGVEPRWEPIVPEVEAELASLLRVILHGEPGPDGGRILRARDDAEAQALFVRVCRELCELAQEPFRARHLRHTTRFVYGGVEVRRDGATVRVLQLP